jgi:hypothetical protein
LSAEGTLTGPTFALLLAGTPVVAVVVGLRGEQIELGELVWSTAPLVPMEVFHAPKGMVHGVPKALAPRTETAKDAAIDATANDVSLGSALARTGRDLSDAQRSLVDTGGFVLGAVTLKLKTAAGTDAAGSLKMARATDLDGGEVSVTLMPSRQALNPTTPTPTMTKAAPAAAPARLAAPAPEATLQARAPQDTAFARAAATPVAAVPMGPVVPVEPPTKAPPPKTPPTLPAPGRTNTPVLVPGATATPATPSVGMPVGGPVGAPATLVGTPAAPVGTPAGTPAGGTGAAAGGIGGAGGASGASGASGAGGASTAGSTASEVSAQVPGVLGYTRALAERKLAAAGFPSEVNLLVTDGTAGTVVRQLPAAGSRLVPGTVVRVFINLGRS